MWLIFAGNKRGRVVKCCQFCFHVINCRAVRVSVKNNKCRIILLCRGRPTTDLTSPSRSGLTPLPLLFSSYSNFVSQPPSQAFAPSSSSSLPALCASISLKAPLLAFWMKKTKKKDTTDLQKIDCNRNETPIRAGSPEELSYWTPLSL